MQVEHMVFSKTAHPMFYPPPRIQYLEVIWVPRTGICLGPRLSPFSSCGGVCQGVQNPIGPVGMKCPEALRGILDPSFPFPQKDTAL